MLIAFYRAAEFASTSKHQRADYVAYNPVWSDATASLHSFR